MQQEEHYYRTESDQWAQSDQWRGRILALCADCRVAVGREQSARAERQRTAWEERLWQLRTMPYR